MRNEWGALDMPPRITEAVLDQKLVELTERDELWLRRNPGTPWMYESGVRYQQEPPGQEKWLPIPAVLAQRFGDCLPLSTLVLRLGAGVTTPTMLASLLPGDSIMGDRKPTTVLAAASTGVKPVLAFDLANGLTLRCSPEHRLFEVGDSPFALIDWEVRAERVRVGVVLRTSEGRGTGRVMAVREESPEPCGDITTCTGRFYLPESDTIVHNCEDLCAWRTAELRVRGDKYRDHRGNLVRTPPENARAFWVDHRTEKNLSKGQYHIRLRRADGRVEDPSAMLGMFGALQVAQAPWLAATHGFR